MADRPRVAVPRSTVGHHHIHLGATNRPRMREAPVTAAQAQHVGSEESQMLRDAMQEAGRQAYAWTMR